MQPATGEHVSSATAPANGQSAYDEHHPPSVDLMDKCVHCGFCLPTCPTYVLWGEEMDSPRGRIYLMRLASDGKIAMNDTFVKHIDQCLGCMACVTACPSGVPYEKIVEPARAQIERRFTRSAADKLHRDFVFSIFPHQTRLRALLAPLYLYQASGLQRLVRSTGLTRLLPKKLREMETLLPPVPRDAFTYNLPERVPAQGKHRRRVGMLTGCVQQVLFAKVNAATARVLAAEGCEVIIPREQGCCGALMIHAGREEEALDFARRLIDTFEGTDVETIAVNAAGCGSNLKEYGFLLRDDPAYAERAKAFAAKCKDVSEILAELGPQAPRHPLPLRVAYHDSCHLQHAQAIRLQPRKVLATIPGIELLEIAESAICCGSAGIYNLVEPDPARALGDRKVQNCLATGAQIIATANPGCILQIASGLGRAGKPLPVVHMMEVLDASIQGRSAESLTRMPGAMNGKNSPILKPVVAAGMLAGAALLGYFAVKKLSKL
ncbi:MAG: glycolate oxidase subunit GlcF [Acidobacteria bacterium]|nr:glycolate oxidase subunit GlcF [Acidobacteriota bacterium]